MIDKVFDYILSKPVFGNAPGAGTVPLLLTIFSCAVILLIIVKIFSDSQDVILYPVLVSFFAFGAGRIYCRWFQYDDDDDDDDDDDVHLTIDQLAPPMTFKLILPPTLYFTAYHLIAVKFLSTTQIVFVLSIALLFYVFCITGYVAVIFTVFSLCFNWNATTLFVISTSVILYQPEIALTKLDNKGGHVRYLQALLKGEILWDLLMSFTISDVVVKLTNPTTYDYGALKIASTIVVQLCGVFFGVVYGLLSNLFHKYAYGHFVSPLFALPMCYTAYSTAELFGTSGCASTVAYAIFTTVVQKPRMTPEHELFAYNLWTVIYTMVRTYFASLIGLTIGIIDKHLDLRMLCFAFCIFASTIMIRALFCFMFLPYLYGSHIQWTEVALATIAPYRGMLSVVVPLRYASTNIDEGFQVLILLYIVALLSVFTNVLKLEWFLNRLDVFHLNKPQISSMTVAVEQINKCRSNMIFAEKLDRLVADSNWSVVYKNTRFPHPYKGRIKTSELAEVYKDDVKTVDCPRCGSRLVAPPTRKELEEITRETKLRVVKAQQVSYLKQRETGTLSLYGYKFLSNVLYTVAYSPDIAINTDDLRLNTDDLKFIQKIESAFKKFHGFTVQLYEWTPSNDFRYGCFRLVTMESFKIIMAIASLIDMILSLSFLYLYLTSGRKTESQTIWPTHTVYLNNVVSILFPIFYFSNVIEATVQIIGLGLSQYFSQRVYVIEFFSCIVIRSLQFALFVEQGSVLREYPYFLKCRTIVVMLNSLMVFRLTRLYIFVVTMIPSVLHSIERAMNEDLLKKYDIGKAYLVGLDRVLKYLNQLTTNRQVLEEIKKEVEDNRQKVTKQLSLIQKEHPTVGITVKTKHAIRHVVNVVNECAVGLLDEGILDNIEYQALNVSVEKIRRRLNNLGVIVPPSPINIMKEVSWLVGDSANTELFLDDAQMSSYDYNDILIRNGDDPVGLYILVSGLLKAVYVPSTTSTQLAAKFGVLPNYDFFENFKFDQPQEDYIVSGNVVGETGVVTGRRYDMTVIAETAVQVYYIPWSTMRSLHDTPTGQALLDRIWKKIAVKISVTLLQFTNAYRHWTKERLLGYLQRGNLLKIIDVHSVSLDHRAEEAVLVEGVALDVNSNNIIFAPYRVPKTVTKLLLPDHKSWSFQTVYETKLFVVTIPGVGCHELLEASKSSLDELESTDDPAKRKGQKARRVGFKPETGED